MSAGVRDGLVWLTCISMRNRLIRKFETSYKGGQMTTRTLRRSAATLVTVGAAAMALTATGQADPNGPQAFYFGADCTGIGSVVLVNAGPSRTAGLQVLGETTIVLVPVNRAIESRALAAGTTCTFMSHGADPSDLEPNEEPETVPVVIVNG
jgi:hypothetical protein